MDATYPGKLAFRIALGGGTVGGTTVGQRNPRPKLPKDTPKRTDRKYTRVLQVSAMRNLHQLRYDTGR